MSAVYTGLTETATKYHVNRFADTEKTEAFQPPSKSYHLQNLLLCLIFEKTETSLSVQFMLYHLSRFDDWISGRRSGKKRMSGYLKSYQRRYAHPVFYDKPQSIYHLPNTLSSGYLPSYDRSVVAGCYKFYNLFMSIFQTARMFVDPFKCSR